MRKKALLGVGLALFAGSTVTAQFASERAPIGAPKTAPALPPGLAPAAPTAPLQPAGSVVPGGAYVPPSSGFQPALVVQTPRPEPLPVNLEIPTVLGADHPWLIKPEHGPYFIMVKSYVRPTKGRDGKVPDGGLTARELAEGLASEIRDLYRVQAFLFEYISEERKAEMRQIATERAKAQAYVAQLNGLKQKSQLQGMEFMEPDNKIHIMTHSHRDQIGVLVGGFQTEADATKALAKLKTWPTPKNEVLLDKGLILSNTGGKQTTETAAINPYATAFVVPNPAISRVTQQGARKGLDQFIVKLNEGQPYSLLKATKTWTLSVKSFTSPVEFVNKNSDTSLMRKMGFGKGADVLAAGAEQAESLAKVLRQMKGPAGIDGRGGQALNLEAFVLHTRTSSLVTVGQFDGPDDPALLATKRMLTALKVNTSEDQTGTRPVMTAPASLFDNIIPMPIPKRD